MRVLLDEGGQGGDERGSGGFGEADVGAADACVVGALYVQAQQFVANLYSRVPALGYGMP